MASSRRPANRRKSSGGSLGRVKEAAAKSRKGDVDFLKLSDGDVVQMRVIRFEDTYVHRTPIQTKNGKLMIDVPCLDPDDEGKRCPGCKEDLQRRYKFFVIAIVRDYEGDDGKAKDQIKVWSGGITVGKRLAKMHSKTRLEKRDIEVEREGSGKDDTSYDVDWATDEPEPLSEADEKLKEQADKLDISRYIDPPKAEDFFKSWGETGKDDDDDGETGKKSIERGSGFARRRRAKDEDEEKERPKRRSSRSSGTSSKKSGLARAAEKRNGKSSSSSKSSKRTSGKTTIKRRRSN